MEPSISVVSEMFSLVSLLYICSNKIGWLSEVGFIFISSQYIASVPCIFKFFLFFEARTLCFSPSFEVTGVEKS